MAEHDRVRVYEAFAAALLEHGVDTVFGLMGDANMLYAGDYQDRGGRFVRVVHEGSAVGMADSWSRMTGRVGVASVTHGPAVSNTLTSLVEAVRSRSHVLLVTGDTPREPTHFQRLDLAAVATTAGAGYEKVHKPESLVRDLNRAMQRVLAEDRPVLLDLAIGMLRQDAGQQPPVARAVPRARGVPSEEQLGGAIGLIAAAKRPVVLAGRGAVASGARDELVALSGRIAAPLATSLLAKDLFRGHPSDIGICGNLSHSVASRAITEADCIIAFGASLNAHTSFHGEIMAGTKVVQVDADPGAFDWYTRVDEAVAGDAKAVAAAINEALDAVEHRPATGWLRGIQQEAASHRPSDDFQDRSAADTVDVRTAMIRLDEVLPDTRVVVSDIGRFVVGVWPYLRVADARDFTSMGAFGSIGLGLAGAIGAAVARPGDLTVAVVGDGGFMMSMAEFTTAVRERLPLLVVVLDDGAYGAEHYKLVHFGMDAGYSLNDWPELVPMAEAMGARGMTVRKPAELDALTEIVADLDGPFLVDVKLDPNVNVLA
ncbi:thiamine pyrophosphate-binding protein [Pseudonocardia kunmingensis]|uniref:Thiamine pyrophosphate-dependent acetolactate synthase large subunit-like protein n=1 Tax=Pseudonocardia kunmingensis TaxID=630975 RepID=A0A543DPV4_9PSEU|nr:thiamine pyrophosphate-binding protein [Pseudonocardia kunmingensis]TQM11372.1 thiamine pyrophosphate-dependent acetolactate synthase large subunit-like protein [Pseudonocardia kunmingensis]